MIPERPDARGLYAWIRAALPDLPAAAARWLARRVAAGRRPETIPGLAAEAARQVLGALEQGVERSRTLGYLVECGLSLNAAARAFLQFGADAAALVRENPYLLAAVLDLEFAELDRVAARRGWPPDSMERLRGALRRALARMTLGQGHTGMGRQALLAEAGRLLAASQAWAPAPAPVAEERLREALDDPGADVRRLPEVGRETRVLLRRGGLFTASANRQVLWNAPIYWSEIQIADRVQALLQAGVRLAGAPAIPGLGRDQQEAVAAFWRHPVLVVTGAPGTGKTFVARAILESIRQHRPGWRAALAAPTGMAAQRLAAAAGQPAATVHRLLNMTPAGRCPYTWDRHPLPADVLLIDEASMLDVFLCRDLAWAAANGARLVLLGDPDQLLPVGPGAVLRDLIRGGVPHVTLTEVRRQGPGSAIPHVAAGVLQGALEPDGADVVLAPPETVWDLDPREVQLLAAYRDGAKHPYATGPLNEALQARLNPGGGPFRPGDPVVQIRSLRLESGEWIPNGERGRVVEVQADRRSGEPAAVAVEYPGLGLARRFYGLECFRCLELAYALTVHKAQGSEFDQVAVVIGEGGRFWDRRLLYAALTRARRKVWLLGSAAAVRAIAAREPAARRTLLARRLARRLGGAPGGGVA